MNIEEFLISFKDFDNTTIQNKTYPKNVNYFMDYKPLKYVQNKHIYKEDDQNTYMLYQKNNNQEIYCLGIDQELDYIKKLDYELKLPIKNRMHLSDAILEGIELFDNLPSKYDNFFINNNTKISMSLTYKLLDNLETIDEFEQRLLLTPFDNIPIKKDMYLAQFIYFIKKYLEFRFDDSGKKTKLSKNSFNSALNSGLLRYIKSNEKSLFYQIIIKKI